MFGLGWSELAAVILVVTLLFYSKKLPEIVRNIAKSFKDFRKEIKDESEDKESSGKKNGHE